MTLLKAVMTECREQPAVTVEPTTAKAVTLCNSLLLTDFSPNANQAVPYAAALAQQYHGKVYLVHVISPEMYEYLPPELAPQIQSHIQSYGQRRMQQLLTQPCLQQVSCEATVREGEIWDTLKTLSREFQIDIIVMGTQGRRGLKKALTGAVADEVLHMAQIPVLTVGPHCSGMVSEHRLKRILYATDFSADSVRAMGYAL